MLAIARPAAFARRQTARAIRRKCPAEAVNLTPTQPDQPHSGIIPTAVCVSDISIGDARDVSIGGLQTLSIPV
jgi:hypothetical protein